MKILITGTHGTGKSTLLHELSQLPEFKEYQFIGGVTRKAKNLGFQINEGGDWKTQLYCAASDIINLLENEHRDVIYDRSIIDTFIYTEFLICSGEPWILVDRIVLNTLKLFIDRFDLIIWLRPEFEIKNDDVRSTSVNFQKGIDKYFEDFFRVQKIEVHQLSGSIEERVEQFRKIYNHG